MEVVDTGNVDNTDKGLDNFGAALGWPEDKGTCTESYTQDRVLGPVFAKDHMRMMQM